MNREIHVPLRESLKVRFLWATRPAILAQHACASEMDVVAKIEIEDSMRHAERQIDQTRRRVVLGEAIAHDEKVFSIFETHTKWISKGKAGVPSSKP